MKDGEIVEGKDGRRFKAIEVSRLNGCPGCAFLKDDDCGRQEILGRPHSDFSCCSPIDVIFVEIQKSIEVCQNVTVEKLTDERLMQRACAITIDKDSKATLDSIYDCEHSPIRTQMFWIEMKNIPSFVSVHLVRHKFGVEHFVKSLREDRCGKGNEVETRNSPVNHGMLINAQALINMARKRLCGKASKETLAVMAMIKEKVQEVDPVLAKYLVPECIYRGGVCHEPKSCGVCPKKASKS
jgi:hypothetical protein